MSKHQVKNHLRSQPHQTSHPTVIPVEISINNEKKEDYRRVIWKINGNQGLHISS